MAPYPKVLDIFKIIIEFIRNILFMPINIGEGFTINIFSIIAFIFVTIVILRFIFGDVNISMGDKAEKFSKPKDGKTPVRIDRLKR